MSRWNKNYPTIGIIVGCISILFFLGVFISLLQIFFTTGRCETELMVMMWVAALISALYILAIVKKYHKLMIPWFVMCCLILLFTVFMSFSYLYAALLFGAPSFLLLLVLLKYSCLLGIEIAIVSVSCHLYSDIKKENITTAEADSHNEATLV